MVCKCKKMFNNSLNFIARLGKIIITRKSYDTLQGKLKKFVNINITI